MKMLNFKKNPEKEKVARFKDLPVIFITFFLVLFPWIVFRAHNMDDAYYIIKKIVLDFPWVGSIEMFYPKRLAIIGLIIFVEWIQRDKDHPLHLDIFPKWLRYLIYYGIIVSILLYGTYNYTPFIYFQF